MFKLVLEKAEDPEIKLPTSARSWKKQEFQKNIYFCFIDYAKALTVWITINCGKFWKRWEYQTTWPASWEICMQVRKQQLELDMDIYIYIDRRTITEQSTLYIWCNHTHHSERSYAKSWPDHATEKGPGEWLSVLFVLHSSLRLLYPAAAAKSLHSCPTLCDPIDGRPLGSPVPGILQARTLGWVLYPAVISKADTRL